RPAAGPPSRNTRPRRWSAAWRRGRPPGRRWGSGCDRPSAQDAVEGGPLDQLHGVEVGAVVLAGGVDGNDGGVVQSGSGLGLTAEALDGAAGQAELAGEHLEGDLAVEGDLAGLEDDTHAAPADLAADLEVAQTFADQLAHRPGASANADVRPVG